MPRWIGRLPKVVDKVEDKVIHKPTMILPKVLPKLPKILPKPTMILPKVLPKLHKILPKVMWNYQLLK